LVQLTVEGPNPQLVAALANTLPQVFVDELRSIQVSRFAESKVSLSTQLDSLNRQIETTRLQLDELENRRTARDEIEFNRLSNALTQYQTSYANLLQSYETLRLTEAQSTDNIVIMESATVPAAPVSPRVLVNTLLATVVGALAALGIVFLIEYLDDRVQTPEDLRRIADVPVLGAIGKTPGAGNSRRGRKRGHAAPDQEDGPEQLISLAEPRHPIVEAYRRMRTNLQYYNLDRGVKSLVVTSAESSEGKSVTSANLAVVMAQSGLRVALVDADLRKPRQHHIFGIKRQPGLAEALVTGELTPALLQSIPQVPNLQVLTCGESVPNPAEVLGSHRFQQLMAQLGEQSDIIIYDTPPLLAVTDAQVVGRVGDGVLLVINTQQTSGAAVHRALENLAQVNVPVMGAVLNRLSGSGRSYYYYYYYYTYGNYYGGDDDHKGRRGKNSRRALAAEKL
jgi:capsular exopolysaccharide synthesis family protein